MAPAARFGGVELEPAAASLFLRHFIANNNHLKKHDNKNKKTNLTTKTKHTNPNDNIVRMRFADVEGKISIFKCEII